MVENIVNVPICAVEQMLGAVTNKIANMADSLVGSLMPGITKVLGFALNIKTFLLDGINLFKKVKGIFTCGEAQDCPTTNVFKNSVGDQKEKEEDDSKKNWKNIFQGAADALAPLNTPKVLNTLSGGGIVGAATSISNSFEDTYGNWSIFGEKLSDVEETESNCNTGNLFACGLPKVELFGGGGIGGAAKVVLGKVKEEFNFDDLYAEAKRTASVVGIELADGGSGYTSPPIVTVTDSCDKGYGAYAQANIDYNVKSPSYGEIISISVLFSGENYPAEEEEVPLYISGVVIDNPGEGYEDGDTLDDFELTIIDGEIRDVTLVNRRVYTDLPELNINTDLGFGAVLRPLMSKTRPPGDVIQVIDCIGKV